MSPIYKEARRCYKANEFPSIRIERSEDGTAAAYSKTGKFLQIFSSRRAAEAELERQYSRARKFIN